MRKFLTVVAIILAVIWVTNDPTGAAADVRHLLDGLSAFVRAV
jgi:hypothetical protein